MHSTCETTDLLVFSHLRWDFVFQRPQHLLSRHAKHRRVFYFEEPVFGMTEHPRLHLRNSEENVQIAIPYLPSGIEAHEIEGTLRELVDELVYALGIHDYSLWYYTPMALAFTEHLKPSVIIFDCMDELSLFKGAPQELIDREAELLKKAHVVFTGGLSLYEAKKHLHQNIHPFPSSIDFDHFSKCRRMVDTNKNQTKLSHPRIGFYGVVDERFNIELLGEMADLRPNYQFMIIGPVMKIDPTTLPQRPNIHYLGKKDYSELPYFLAEWNCTMMPFALNDSTRFISPTKTPEYLAAGKPVVSTSIHDVIHPYADAKLVHIADNAQDFVDCIEKAMLESDEAGWIENVDKFLDGNNWDSTFLKMAALETEVREKLMESSSTKIPEYDGSLMERVSNAQA